MTPLLSITELLDRLNQVDESHEIEAKRSESELGKSALETISAFANAPGMGGGYLLFGVTEDKSRFIPTGVQDPKKIEQDLLSVCSTSFNRCVRPRVWTEVLEGASLVAAFIPEAAPAEKPIFIETRGMLHGSFRRVGSSDVRCVEDDLRELFQQQSFAPYEDSLVQDAELGEIDPDAIAIYRHALIKHNPQTTLASASDEALLQAVGGIRRVDGRLVPTVSGVLLFGRHLLLRRLWPMLRVDYIRVLGTQWDPDPQRRYDSVDVLEPLVVTFRRIFGAVVDDLPRSFVLEPGSPENKDRLVVPETAIREILVNALIHRDYRVATTIQIVRFSDRIEVRNPGYSLADDDQFGELGSFPRNPHITGVFREMHLAESKGTGISSVRRVMREAGLTPPVFDSDRSKNRFIATLWIHNLIADEDATWLKALGTSRVNDTQAKALVLARRQGWVSNSTLRDLTGLDTLGASAQLKKLREAGLLDAKGSGSATRYVLSAQARGTEGARKGKLDQEAGESPSPARESEEARGIIPKGQDLAPDLSRELDTEGQDLAPDLSRKLDTEHHDLPADLRLDLGRLGSRAKAKAIQSLLLRICEIGPIDAARLAKLLRRDSEVLVRDHLTPMIREGVLRLLYPDRPNDPRQAYVAVGRSNANHDQGGT